MKQRIHTVFLALAALVLFANTALGEGPLLAIGKITFLGTEPVGDQRAQFRLHLEGRCGRSGSDQGDASLWIAVRSGRMDVGWGHNTADFRNAYSTALTALLGNKDVQIDNLDKCSDGAQVELPSGMFGIFQ